MSTRDELLRAAARNDRFLYRLDAEVVRDILAAYEAARRELIAIITDRRNALYAGTFKGERETRLRELARDVEMLRSIEARLETLRRQVGQAVQSAWRSAIDGARDASREEMELLLSGLDLPGHWLAFMQVDYTSVEIGLQEALALFEQSQKQLATLLRSELRVGLLRGESFDTLVKRLLGRDAGLFANGRRSAELGARRNVITANNAARQAWYEVWGQQIPGLMKQAVAAIDERTTDCCLRVHGQVQPINEPYVLTGKPRFADKMQYPAFHWHCRTSSVAYHPDFEKGAKVTTADMIAAAKAELEAQNNGSREEIHPAHATSKRA